MVHEKIERNLRKSTWSAVCFGDPEEALTCLRRAAMPDLLIVDNRMPLMNGLDFIDRLGWAVSSMSSRVYLCSSVRPPFDICRLAEQIDVGILSKDVLLTRADLLLFLDVR